MKRVTILTLANVTTRQFRNNMSQKENSRLVDYLNDERFTVYGVVDYFTPHCWVVTYNTPETDMLIAACGSVDDKPITREDFTMISDLVGKKCAYGLTNRDFETNLFRTLNFRPHESIYEFESSSFSAVEDRPQIQLLYRTTINPQIRLQIESILYQEGVRPELFFDNINCVRFHTAAYIVNGEVYGIIQLQIDTHGNPNIRLLITDEKHRRVGIATLLICFIGKHMSTIHPHFYISVAEDYAPAINLVSERLCKRFKVGKLVARTVTSEMEVESLNWYKKRLREKDSFGNITSDEEEFDTEGEEELVE